MKIANFLFSKIKVKKKINEINYALNKNFA